MFSAPVTAQFDPGAYLMQPIVFSGAPTPHMISIFGNLLNPNSVVINQAVAGNLFTFDVSHHLSFSAFDHSSPHLTSPDLAVTDLSC